MSDIKIVEFACGRLGICLYFVDISRHLSDQFVDETIQLFWIPLRDQSYATVGQVLYKAAHVESSPDSNGRIAKPHTLHMAAEMERPAAHETWTGPLPN